MFTVKAAGLLMKCSLSRNGHGQHQCIERWVVEALADKLFSSEQDTWCCRRQFIELLDRNGRCFFDIRPCTMGHACGMVQLRGDVLHDPRVRCGQNAIASRPRPSADASPSRATRHTAVSIASPSRHLPPAFDRPSAAQHGTALPGVEDFLASPSGSMVLPVPVRPGRGACRAKDPSYVWPCRRRDHAMCGCL